MYNKVGNQGNFTEFFKEQGMLSQFGNAGFHTVRYYGWTVLSLDDPRYSGGAQCCLVMEFIDGGDLRTWIRRFNQNTNTTFKRDQTYSNSDNNTSAKISQNYYHMTLKRLMKMAADVADGMLFLHTQVQFLSNEKYS